MTELCRNELCEIRIERDKLPPKPLPPVDDGQLSLLIPSWTAAASSGGQQPAHGRCLLGSECGSWPRAPDGGGFRRFTEGKKGALTTGCCWPHTTHASCQQIGVAGCPNPAGGGFGGSADDLSRRPLLVLQRNYFDMRTPRRYYIYSVISPIFSPGILLPIAGDSRLSLVSDRVVLPTLP